MDGSEDTKMLPNITNMAAPELKKHAGSLIQNNATKLVQETEAFPSEASDGSWAMVIQVAVFLVIVVALVAVVSTCVTVMMKKAKQ